MDYLKFYINQQINLYQKLDINKINKIKNLIFNKIKKKLFLLVVMEVRLQFLIIFYVILIKVSNYQVIKNIYQR